MSEEVGGTPFPDGEDHGGADEEFASVVFDEAFIRAAAIHEPTAQERMVAAAQARAEAEAARTRVGAADDEDDDGHPYDDYRAGRHGSPEDEDDEDDEDDVRAWPDRGPHRHRRPYGGHSRWHRIIAWLLAVLMGIGVVALTFAAVYRGAAGGSRQPSPPPASGRVDTPAATVHPPVRVASPAAAP